MKISEASPRAEKNKQLVKRWIKNTALIASGATVGTGLGMVAERVVKKTIGPKFRSLPPSGRSPYLAVSAAAAAAAALLAASRLEKHTKHE